MKKSMIFILTTALVFSAACNRNQTLPDGFVYTTDFNFPVR